MCVGQSWPRLSWATEHCWWTCKEAMVVYSLAIDGSSGRLPSNHWCFNHTWNSAPIHHWPPPVNRTDQSMLVHTPHQCKPSHILLIKIQNTKQNTKQKIQNTQNTNITGGVCPMPPLLIVALLWLRQTDNRTSSSHSSIVSCSLVCPHSLLYIYIYGICFVNIQIQKE